MNKNHVNHQVGQAIQELRQSQELTQSEFAQKIGVKRATITCIESGNQGVSILTLGIICNEFGVDPNRILPASFYPDAGSD